jgi:CheY-like chemotaxis protein
MVEPTTKLILVVEDEAATRTMLSLVLEAQGYAVMTACDGQDALDKVQSVHPDAILLDLMLPGVDGFEVIERLSTMPTAVPIITISAHGTRPQYSPHIVRAVLEKPCPTEVILRTLEGVLTEACSVR